MSKDCIICGKPVSNDRTTAIGYDGSRPTHVGCLFTVMPNNSAVETLAEKYWNVIVDFSDPKYHGSALSFELPQHTPLKDVYLVDLTKLDALIHQAEVEARIDELKYLLEDTEVWDSVKPIKDRLSALQATKGGEE